MHSTFLSIIVLYVITSVYSLDITKDVFSNDLDYLPAAFGNFNADKWTDLFALEKYSNGSFALHVLIANQNPPLLRPTGPVCGFKNLKVKSIIPGDFDGDGDSDVLVISLNGSLYYDVYILWGNFDTMECLKDESKPLITLKNQPLVFDYNGDMIPDLFAEDDKGVRSVWIFDHSHDKPKKVAFGQPLTEPFALLPLKSSGGHAFVDIDSDYVADLWITTNNYFELWLSSDNFTKYTIVKFPKLDDQESLVVGQSTFVDIDLDGEIELLLPVCFDASCVKSAIFIYEFTLQKWYNLKVDFYNKLKGTLWSFEAHSSYLYANTITPRIGDFNLDGYPDVLITMFDDKSKPQVILLMNEGCTSCLYSQSLVPNWGIFQSWGHSVMGAFFDFEEDGTLDVLLVNVTQSGVQKYQVGAYRNTDEYDAMFMKVLALTGQCYHNCSPSHNSNSFGTNQPGIALRYSMTSSTGSIQSACSTQLTQSSHFALQLPFTHFGLGRNWNFVDKLLVGIPSDHYNRSGNYNYDSILYSYEGSPIRKSTFTQIIPNSQLVVAPFPMNQPELWETKLFITPSKAMLMTGGALVATCLFVAAIIAVLHIKEKKQDKKEKLQQAQRFHFDAM